MGAAFDAMCENEELQSKLSSKNRQIREQKKLLIEFTEMVLDYLDEDNGGNYTLNDVEKKAKSILNKLNNKKKK